jgi:hypothetical protein
MDNAFRLEGIPCFILMLQEILLRISHYKGSNGDTTNDDTIYVL